MSKIFFSHEFTFADAPENYFSREFNFENRPYFTRNRENLFPWNLESKSEYSINLEITCHLFQITKMFKILLILFIIELYGRISFLKKSLHWTYIWPGQQPSPSVSYLCTNTMWLQRHHKSDVGLWRRVAAPVTAKVSWVESTTFINAWLWVRYSNHQAIAPHGALFTCLVYRRLLLLLEIWNLGFHI